jgi:hypothetical protein
MNIVDIRVEFYYFRVSCTVCEMLAWHAVACFEWESLVAKWPGDQATVATGVLAALPCREGEGLDPKDLPAAPPEPGEADGEPHGDLDVVAVDVGVALAAGGKTGGRILIRPTGEAVRWAARVPVVGTDAGLDREAVNEPETHGRGPVPAEVRHRVQEGHVRATDLGVRDLFTKIGLA